MATVDTFMAACLGAGQDCLPPVSVTSCSTRTGSPASRASSRPSSSTSSLSSLPKVELPLVHQDRPISRSSSTSELPSLTKCAPDGSSQKIVRRTIRQSVAGATDKMHFSRRKTWPEDSEKQPKLGRSHSHAGPTLRTKGCKKEAPDEEAQTQAIKALVIHLASKKSFQDVIHTLCRHVLSYDGTKAFTEEHVRQSVDFVLSGGDGRSAASEYDASALCASQESKAGTGPLAMRVIRVLADRAKLSLAEVAGQILWHFRKADALNDRLMRSTAKDFTWIDLASVENICRTAKPNELVEKVFQQHANDDGRLDERAFLKIMDRSFQGYMVQEDGTTTYTGSKASCRRTDLDQLFYAQAHHKGSRGLTCDGFKHVLVKLAQNMSVHPTSMFITVGGLGQ